VQATCDHIRMIEEGRMVFSGTVDEFDNYILPSTLLVTLLQAPPREELLRMPGVVRVDELGGPRYRIHFSDTRDVSEHLIETAVANGWRITDITMEKSSPDTIFAALSRKI